VQRHHSSDTTVAFTLFPGGHSSTKLGSAAASSSPPPTLHPTTATPPHQSFQILPAADSFAQSHVKNYVKRILSSPAPERTEVATLGSCVDISTSASPSVVDVVPRQLSTEERRLYAPTLDMTPAYVSSFLLPVDVFVKDRLTRCHITVTGLAADAKTSVIAACMHAERCLDALRIPLFASERRQRQRVLQAQAEGRTAAEVSDVPLELAQVLLPPPVALPSGATSSTTERMASYQLTQKTQVHSTMAEEGAAFTPSAERSTNNCFSSAASAEQGMNGGGGSCSVPAQRHLRQKPAIPRRPKRRCDNYSTRYGNDCFLQVALSELSLLQSTLFAHNRPPDDEEDDIDAAQEVNAMHISPEEVSVLNPDLLPRNGADTPSRYGDAVAATASGRAYRTNTSHSIMLEQTMKSQSRKGGLAKIDESEGGLYDLVECHPGEWYMEPEVPGSWCLCDAGAVARVNGYVHRVTGSTFKDSVQVHFTEEDTFQFLEHKSRYGVAMKQWFTVSLDLGEIGVRATGKATSQETACDLCAMHAELLLQWYGVPLYANPHAQALYYDACLKWGRRVAPAPIDPSTVNTQTAKLPRPLKELFRNRKRRLRCAEKNVMEKLLTLNRAVVHAYRKHFCEIDLFATDKYAELLSLVDSCLRSFMVAMQHPFESAYFNLIYSKDSQYRATIYLPLPVSYGIRGGYAIANTPQRSIKLCALNAIDVLCALDAIPQVCMAQPRWKRLMELRESLGFIMPGSYLYAKKLAKATTDAARAALGPPPPLPHPLLRSPPAYREIVGLSPTIPPHEDVWRILLLDAGVFDVAPDIMTTSKLTNTQGHNPYLHMPREFFAEAAKYLFRWDGDEKGLPQHFFHYTGAQRFQNTMRTTANNFWFELPLDPAVYGRRVAIGRCQNRRGAERMLYIHALRILRALKLAPWDELPLNELVRALYGGNINKAKRRLLEWRNLCEAVLDGRDDPEDENPALSIPEAQITKDVSAPKTATNSPTKRNEKSAATPVNMLHVLSPHPVMSRELAVLTFR
jgi:hypothetical protein